MQFQPFQAMLLNLEPAAGFDVWTIFGNSVTTKASRVYKSCIWVALYKPSNGCGKVAGSRNIRFCFGC
jgi:hypothetical protein